MRIAQPDRAFELIGFFLELYFFHKQLKSAFPLYSSLSVIIILYCAHIRSWSPPEIGWLFPQRAFEGAIIPTWAIAEVLG